LANAFREANTGPALLLGLPAASFAALSHDVPVSGSRLGAAAAASVNLRQCSSREDVSYGASATAGHKAKITATTDSANDILIMNLPMLIGHLAF